MLRIHILAISLLISGSFSLYNEPYRPQFHFSPPKGWINDPNGLVFCNGTFHLFYQNNPNDTVAGNIHWGHATSLDLVHWKHLPIALYPKDDNLIYSGSAIIDEDNVTGLRTNGNMATMIAVFTAHDEITNEQKQWMAYSNDGPEYKNFKYYKQNPIIPNLNPSVQKNFRDPNVFKFNDHYVIAIAAHDRILIYNSNDLLEWKLVSEFGANLHGRVRECPSLFPINIIIEGVEVEKWILTMSLWDYITDSGEVFPNQQYYIGSFDGKTFTYDYTEDTELWVDHGPDSYAGIVFNQVPKDRRIFISWMNRWQYAPHLNFNIWNGQMGLAREFKLIPGNGLIRLASLPVPELSKLRTERLVTKKNVPITDNCVYNIGANGTEEKEKLVDIVLILDLTHFKANDSFDIVFFDEHDELKISFKQNEFILDRSKAGRTDFPNFAVPWKAPRFTDSPELEMRIVIDRASIEAYIDHGLTVMTALYYSKENIASKMHIRPSTTNSSIILKKLKVYRMKSIWN